MKEKINVSSSPNEGQNYDKIAPEFAAMRNDFSTEKKYLDLLKNYLKPGDEILDLGCGHGFLASYLSEQQFKVIGIDASEKLLGIAKRNHPSMNFIFGDIRTVEINKTFDAVLEWWCLFHLPKEDQLKMFPRFARWLKPNGILEFTTGGSEYEGIHTDMLNQPLLFCSHDTWVYEKALKENNFEVLLKESDQKDHLAWIAGKTI